MDYEKPHQELVKCVVVGDTAVGKTRLVCARACNTKLELNQFLTTHIPTVWAIDQYRMRKDVLERSVEIVDKVNVSLRLWDTFGDHEKDRRFAYGRSDVVLLCFSIANPISLRNCKLIWYPEIRKFCPNTPIVLVGCKNDLRFMYRDEKFLSLWREKSPFFRPLRECDILTPEQGRLVGNELNAPYYESSVLTNFGVNEIFENVIRIALIARRQQKFWMTNLKPIKSASYQKPFCPPPPNPPIITVPPSEFVEQLLSLQSSDSLTDITIQVDNNNNNNNLISNNYTINNNKCILKLHKAILAASSPILCEYFFQIGSITITATTTTTTTTFNNSITTTTLTSSTLISTSYLGLNNPITNSDMSISSSVCTSNDHFNQAMDTDPLLSNSFNEKSSTLNTTPPSALSSSAFTSKFLATKNVLEKLGNRFRPFRPSSSIKEQTSTRDNKNLFDSKANLRRSSSCGNIEKSKEHCNGHSLIEGNEKLLHHPLFKKILFTIDNETFNNNTNCGSDNINEYVNVGLNDKLSTCKNDWSKRHKLTLILSQVISERSLRAIIQFLYTGKIHDKSVPISELIDAAELFEVDELVKILKSVELSNQYLDSCTCFNEDYINKHLQFLQKRFYSFNKQKLFVDVTFQFDDGLCFAHKCILMARCEMMDAMFRGDFKESFAKVVYFPGVSCETFEQFLYFIYTDQIDPNITSKNCLPLLELANRFCLTRLMALIEHKVIDELEIEITSGIERAEQSLMLLEQAQMHNANQLAEWCLYQITIHYNEMSHHNPRLLRSLHPENQAYLNRNRWPPVWYLKELDFYERCIREESLQIKPPKGLKRSYRSNGGFLCFSVKSKKKD